MAIMELKNSVNSGGLSPRVMPLAELKTSALRETVAMSSWRVTHQ